MNPTELIPTYEEALAALKNGDSAVLENALFPFEIEDAYYIEQVTKAVRSLLNRPDLTPFQIVAIGRALHGLGRLPLRTPGLEIQLSLSETVSNESMSYTLILTAEQFSTSSGGFVSFDHGSDSISGPTFEVGPGMREYTGFVITLENWPTIFCEMTASKLEIEDESDDNLLDWEHPDGTRFWDWIVDHA